MEERKPSASAIIMGRTQSKFGRGSSQFLDEKIDALVEEEYVNMNLRESECDSPMKTPPEKEHEEDKVPDFNGNRPENI